MEEQVCGAITYFPRRRKTRCLEPDRNHQGPHWDYVEWIKCSCKYFCLGHPVEQVKRCKHTEHIDEVGTLGT
jgi:hypothetical protein